MAAQDTHPNSRKVHVGPRRVPVREIRLSGGEPALQVYDTSGPQGHDVRAGLPKLRERRVQLWALGLVVLIVVLLTVPPFGFVQGFSDVAGSNTYGPVSPIEAMELTAEWLRFARLIER